MKFFQVAGAFGDNEQANRVFWKYFDFTSFLSYYLLPCNRVTLQCALWVKRACNWAVHSSIIYACLSFSSVTEGSRFKPRIFLL